MRLTKEKKIEQSAENGKDQNKKYPRQLIRFFIPAGNDVYGNENAYELQSASDDDGSPASAENIKKKDRKLHENQKAEKKPSAQKIAEPFRFFGRFHNVKILS